MKNIYKTTALRLAVICALLVLNACASSSDSNGDGNIDRNTGHTALKQLYQSQFCTTPIFAIKEGITLLDQAKLDAIVGAGLILPTKDGPTVKPGFHTVLISQGSKPSAGLGVELSGNVAHIETNTLMLPITFSQPPANQASASVMTSPCLVLEVKEGDYAAVKAGGYWLRVP